MKRSVHAGWLLAVLLAGCSRVPTTTTEWPPPQSPPATITGQVIKGYVQGSLVFADANGNGVADAGEVVVETDSQGRFTLPASQTGAITAMGGVDTVTNVPLTGNVFRAPNPVPLFTGVTTVSANTVVTPFTTLITTLIINSGSTPSEAETRIRNAFGVTLPAGSTLLTFDPVGKAAGAAVEDKSEAVMNTLSAVRSMLEGAGVPDSANRAAQAMTELASAATQPLRLDDTAVVGSVLNSALSATDLGASSAADVERVAAAISSVNNQLLSNSGTGEQAVNVTRFAQSQLQDLMTQVGQTAAQDPGASIDLDRLDEGATATITQIVESPADVISQNQATSIAAALRLEDQVFAFALRPAVVLVNGSAAAVQTVSVRFDLPELELKKVAGADDSAVETLLPGAAGAYLLEYAELDKIRIVPPADFNGRIALTVTLTYAGVGARPAESLHVDLAPVNDAPLAAAGFTATLRPTVAGTAGTLFAAAFSDAHDARQPLGSAPDLLAGIAIAANDAALSQGVWQYSADGQTWIDLPVVSENSALTIATSTRIRFQPASGIASEQPGVLTAYLVDSSAGPVVAGARVSVVAAARGGTSRYASAAVTLASGPIVNLASPALSQATGPIVNADMLASGLPLTVSIAAAQAAAGDLVELRLDGRPFEPSLTRVLTDDDVERGTITFTIPVSGLGADGEKSVSVVLTYATSGVTLASRPLALSLDTEAPAAPTLSLTAASDTGVSGSDRITADASPTLRINLPLVGRAKAGDEVRLQDGATLLAEVRLDTADIAAGFVNLRTGTLTDGVHGLTARLLDVAANLSPSSDVVAVAVDTEAPAAVTLDLAAETTTAAIDVHEAKDFVLSGGGAETGSTVRVEITTIPAAPLDFRATPDLSGRFATVVDASRAGGPGSVTIAARVVDIAGNTGPVALAQLDVTPAAAGSLIEGAAQTDETAAGMSGADTFVAGIGPRQDYFVGSSGFDTVRLRGRQADYGLAIVPAAQREVHAELIGSAVLQPDAPLVRIAGRGASGGEILFVQAEALEFADGRLRITTREFVSAASAAGGAAVAGGRGSERLFATNAGQQLSGGGGGDVFVGGTGADTLSIYGYSAAERELVGGDGDDTLRIGGQSAISGARVLAHGGSGRDRFQILPENGIDLDIVIKDLHPGEDQIDLSALRIRQGQVLRALTLADLGLPALSSALAMSSRSASIELAGFVGISGTPLRGTLRLELSPYGAPGLTAGDFILGGS